MKKNSILFCIFYIYMASSSLAQNSLVKKWDKSFGGGNDEWLSNLQVTNDGGFIL
ncbi:MAG: hypothetical protein K0S44_1351, partial [Bacteroidetes bacterium]|nr:hypothetical protein [Bacteroidota bacterium]